MGITELRQKLEAARNSFDYRLEEILINIAEQITKLIECQRINRSELAERLSVSPAYVTKLLNGNPNLSIKSLLKISDVLGQTLDIRFSPKLEIAHAAATTVVAEPIRNFVQSYQIQTQVLCISKKPSEANSDLALAA